MEALRLIMHDDLNDRIRIRLRENGFKFCDARQLPNAQPSIDIQRQYQEAPELILEGLNASSTDHEGQVRLEKARLFLFTLLKRRVAPIFFTSCLLLVTLFLQSIVSNQLSLSPRQVMPEVLKIKSSTNAVYDVMQSIRETLTEDGEHFWSSTGSASSSFEEHLLYSTAGACNCIQAIGLRVYRATYQYG